MGRLRTAVTATSPASPPSAGDARSRRSPGQGPSSRPGHPGWLCSECAWPRTLHERIETREEDGMHALVYEGPGHRVWREPPDALVEEDTDAVVRVEAVTICGTDLHILRG